MLGAVLGGVRIDGHAADRIGRAGGRARVMMAGGFAHGWLVCAGLASNTPRGYITAMAGDSKASTVKRLNRIEGQVRGLQRMIDGDRYCADILTQISSVQEALRGVSRELMRNHLKHCATGAIKVGGKPADEMYDEIVDLMYLHNR
jgi:DNA-binding FrmR family transcriptional regulator